MEILKFLLWAVSCTTLGGLLAGSLAVAQPPARQEQLSFKPKLDLKWPGKPSESSQVLATAEGDQKHYSALFTHKHPSGVVLFSAFVEEFPDKALKGASPKELLAAYVFASKKNETSRKEIEHGAKKYPGLEITTRTDKQFGRKVVVMARSRIYEVSVTSKTEAALKIPAVKTFLESLAVGD
jgi:hypothetical protein